jgi:hypothetical protein
VPEAIDSATYELYDRFGAVRLAYVQKNGDFPEVSPFEKKEFIVEFPINFYLGIGDYWGQVNFVKDGKILASQKNIFKVLKAGSLSGWFSVIVRYIKIHKTYFEIGALVIALLTVIIYRRKLGRLFKRR